MRRRTHFLLAGSALLAVADGAAGYFLTYPNRVVIRNVGEQAVTDVRLELFDHRGRFEMVEEVRELGAGQSVSVRHGLNDSQAEIRYVRSEVEYRYRQPYIDLWRGQGGVRDRARRFAEVGV
jgi:hypothetical protein